MRKNNTGITLIALVVTIVVLLILAAVSISMLTGENGIITNAQNAKNNTGEKETEEKVQIAYSGALAEGEGIIIRENLNSELEKEFGEGNFTLAEDLSMVTIDGKDYYFNGNNSEVLDDTGDVRITNFSIRGTTVTNVPLPSSDFEKVAGTEIDNSYVARGKTGTLYAGDEFVWVPVDKNQQFKVKIEGSGNITSVILTNPVGDTKTIVSNVTAPKSITGITPTVEEKVYNGEYKITVTPEEGEPIVETLDVHSLYAFDVGLIIEPYKAQYGDDYESHIYGGTKGLVSSYSESGEDYTSRVEQNGGFWIGRYEASYKDGKPASVVSTSIQGGSVWNPQTLENGMLWRYQGGLNVANNYNSSLNSSIPTGAAWDRTLGWIYETGNKTLSEIAIDSTSWGNYNNDYGSPAFVACNTGSLPHTIANNIYDLAGNLCESTTELVNAGGIRNVYRGGDYSWSGNDQPAALHTFDDGEIHPNIGFRLVLYK